MGTKCFPPSQAVGDDTGRKGVPLRKEVGAWRGERSGPLKGARLSLRVLVCSSLPSLAPPVLPPLLSLPHLHSL